MMYMIYEEHRNYFFIINIMLYIIDILNVNFSEISIFKL